ncbi:diaminobutyrate acetyltransferase [Photobacterium damselae subsp. damselae]|uniref:diaminobutyrate acetyltransferase n=1 Tax=Photobacterium damselae TaxID=38293 RepID=UPI0015F678C1|nr:diaminobutyrate acetyltransferase [Photobacterium damselae]MBA5684410.1 diaminobutyrate acetyltransferase [Photobacterium damselae subsp. damselae]
MIIPTPWLMHAIIGNRYSQKWIFREPQITDGDNIYNLIKNCPPLDLNSSYCNFLQSTHFSKTCVIAENNDDVSGFISAYIKPDQPNILFIWQIAVAPRYRGNGLAIKMIEHLLNRKELFDIDMIETTITKENQASWSLFKKLDVSKKNEGKVSTFIDGIKHFKGKHETEYLYQIPIK